MFNHKFVKFTIAIIAVIAVAIAIPMTLSGHDVQASSDYTFNGKTYPSEAAKNTAIRQWNDSRLTDAQKKIVRAANDEAAATTGFTSSIYHSR